MAVGMLINVIVTLPYLYYHYQLTVVFNDCSPYHVVYVCFRSEASPDYDGEFVASISLATPTFPWQLYIVHLYNQFFITLDSLLCVPFPCGVESLVLRISCILNLILKYHITG